MYTTLLRRTLPAYWLILPLVLVLCYSCSKFDDELGIQNRESGVVRVVRNGQQIGEAKIDEIVTIYAKIGDPAASIQWFVSDAEAAVISHGAAPIKIAVNEGGLQEFLMDTFNIAIPRAAKIGPGSVYFSINNEIKPALAFTVIKPDILIPNKVLVEPYFLSYSDSVLRTDGSGLYNYSFPSTLRDGVSQEAVVRYALKLTYDRDRQAFFFLDYEGSGSTASLKIRMLKDGRVTTIAGGGTDYLATTANQLKIGVDNFTGSSGPDMVPGPDGKLYFVNMFTIPKVGTSKTEYWSLIQRITPETGVVELLAGGNRLAIPHSNRTTNDYRGLVDGRKDTAMVYFPQGLTFDAAGDLLFLDGKTFGASELLRKMDKEGNLSTVLGATRTTWTPRVDPADGQTYNYLQFADLKQEVEGFGDEVRLAYLKGMVRAGNGKLYLNRGSQIIEVNPDTREAAAIVKMSTSGPLTGTFKEVNLGQISTLDVDFDGNLLYGRTSIYKMDLQTETVAFVAGGGSNSRAAMKQTHPGNEAGFGAINRITFDQFGNLYLGYESVVAYVDVRISRIVIER